MTKNPFKIRLIVIWRRKWWFEVQSCSIAICGWLWLPCLCLFVLASSPLEFPTTNPTKPTAIISLLSLSFALAFQLPPSKSDTGKKGSFLLLPNHPSPTTLGGRPLLRTSRRNSTKRTMPRHGSTLSPNPYPNASTTNTGFRPSRFLSLSLHPFHYIYMKPIWGHFGFLSVLVWYPKFKKF